MNYVIPKCHLKTFHKALISLSKVGRIANILKVTTQFFIPTHRDSYISSYINPIFRVYGVRLGMCLGDPIHGVTDFLVSPISKNSRGLGYFS